MKCVFLFPYSPCSSWAHSGLVPHRSEATPKRHCHSRTDCQVLRKSGEPNIPIGAHLAFSRDVGKSVQHVNVRVICNFQCLDCGQTTATFSHSVKSAKCYTLQQVFTLAFHSVVCVCVCVCRWQVLVIVDAKPRDLGLPTDAYYSVEEVHDVSQSL